MSLNIQSTFNITREKGSFVLLYGSSGAGKTNQARYYQEKFGKTLILETEAGARTLSDVKIDYVTVSKWEDFTEAFKEIREPSFASKGYKCIILDSLTNLSAMLDDFLQKKHVNDDGSKSSNWEQWKEYRDFLVATIEWFKHSDYHVLMIALQDEDTDDNAKRFITPKIRGKAVKSELPAHFDYCWQITCKTENEKKDDGTTEAVTSRYIVTQTYASKNGLISAKTRAPMTRQALQQVEHTANVPELIMKLESAEASAPAQPETKTEKEQKQ